MHFEQILNGPRTDAEWSVHGSSAGCVACRTRVTHSPALCIHVDVLTYLVCLKKFTPFIL